MSFDVQDIRCRTVARWHSLLRAPARSARAASRRRCRRPRITARRRSRERQSRRRRRHAAVRCRREAGARMVEAVSLGCARTRSSTKACATARRSRRPTTSLAPRAKQLRAQVGTSTAAVDRRGRPGDAQRALGVPGLGPQHGAVQLLRRPDCRRTTRSTCSARRATPTRRCAARVNVQAYQLDAARRALAANIVTARSRRRRLHAQIDAHRTARCRLPTMRRAMTQRRYAFGSVSRAERLSAQQNAASLAASLPGLRAAMARDASCAGGAARPHARQRAGRSRPREPRRARAGAGRRAVGAAAHAPRHSGRRCRREGRRGRRRRRDGADVSEPVADRLDGPRRLQLAARAVGRGRDLERSARRCRSRSSMAARCSRNAARRIDTYDAAVLAVQADGAVGVPERREYAGRARTRRAGARLRAIARAARRKASSTNRRHASGSARSRRAPLARASSSSATRSSTRSAIRARV